MLPNLEDHIERQTQVWSIENSQPLEKKKKKKKFEIQTWIGAEMIIKP